MQNVTFLSCLVPFALVISKENIEMLKAKRKRWWWQTKSDVKTHFWL